MRFNIILRYVGLTLLLNAVFMLLSAGISLMNNVDTAFYPLLLSVILTTVLGAFPLIFVEKGEQITSKEGYVIVIGAWLVSCFAGMLPYLLWGGEFSLANAWFESVSGYTTTGSTILNDVEAVPRGLLFWRSSTHWLGGVGVVMFALVVLPSLGRTKLTLSSVELSPLAKDNFRYRTQKTYQILLMVYVGLTAACTVLLKIAGMNWFDAVNHAFSTIATGGFSTKNQSIAYFDSAWIEVILIVFMAIAGLHFGLIFATLTGKKNNIFRSEVARYYLLSIAAASVVIGVSLWHSGIYPTLVSALRYGTFQLVTMATTTGFATADSTLWTPLAIILLILFSLQCACAGSTAGGIKCDRVLLSVKVIKARLLQQQHPNAIIRIKLNNIVQDNDFVNLAMLFIVLYLLLLGLGTIVVTALGVDLMTSFSALVASMGNVGPGFGQVGSMDNYSGLPAVVKYICTLYMLLGRLEIFGLIQLFLIKWWR
ncbi:MAG: TrkH family potassium uptake protein [Rikenellaceae bacterium]|nr:TrkH family potassium uptake protein [Rikenellaceae bacterium]